MRRSNIVRLVFLAALATGTGCRPFTDGLAGGLTDGLGAATASFIEELSSILLGQLTPPAAE